MHAVCARVWRCALLRHLVLEVLDQNLQRATRRFASTTSRDEQINKVRRENVIQPRETKGEESANDTGRQRWEIEFEAVKHWASIGEDKNYDGTRETNTSSGDQRPSRCQVPMPSSDTGENVDKIGSRYRKGKDVMLLARQTIPHRRE